MSHLTVKILSKKEIPVSVSLVWILAVFLRGDSELICINSLS